jgi:hypothetical protein
MPGDNFHLDVCSDSQRHFQYALTMAFDHAAGGKARFYRIDPEKGLILFWAEGAKDAVLLPYPMDCTAATEFVWNWLKTAGYGEQPDHDGDNARGFRVYNESWGHVGNEWQAFVAIRPEWQMYGK